MMTIVGLILLGLMFCIEVCLGSSTQVFNPEIGLEANCEQLRTLSCTEFIGQLLPFVAVSVGGVYLLSMLLR